jgi:hypothetical protein
MEQNKVPCIYGKKAESAVNEIILPLFAKLKDKQLKR